ncbi:hypothetical protein [Rhodococcus erythropolis]|uniref:hypothetical protein n=1 Tax=Rhodococcus erythropolis TaxID=1833 RepID=UPI00366E4059
MNHLWPAVDTRNNQSDETSNQQCRRIEFVFPFTPSTQPGDARALYEPKNLLRAYEQSARKEVRPNCELLITIPLSNNNDLEITIPNSSADWIRSRMHGLCASLGDIDRRARKILRNEFIIGWIELDSPDHGIIDYWAIGVNSEYPIDIHWTGHTWEEEQMK